MFSVVIPAFNAAEFLHKAIESVLQQTCCDFEILVVDDGSTDHTKEVAQRFRDPRIKYIYQNNQGVSAARNTGMRNAEGSHICFLDADDLWYPDHLAEVEKLIRNYPDCRVFFTGYEIRLTTGLSIPRSAVLLKKMKEETFGSDNGYDLLWKYGYIINTNCICFEKEALDRVGCFEPGVKNGEDDDMWYRLLAYYSVAGSKKITTIYNRENSRATAATALVKDWIFLKRVDDIMDSPEVTDERKSSLRKLLERKKLSRIRKEIVAGRKKAAFRKLVKLNVPLIFGKKYLQTWFAMAVPHRWMELTVSRRDRGYFSPETNHTQGAEKKDA